MRSYTWFYCHGAESSDVLMVKTDNPAVYQPENLYISNRKGNWITAEKTKTFSNLAIACTIAISRILYGISRAMSEHWKQLAHACKLSTHGKKDQEFSIFLKIHIFLWFLYLIAVAFLWGWQNSELVSPQRDMKSEIDGHQMFGISTQLSLL